MVVFCSSLISCFPAMLVQVLLLLHLSAFSELSSRGNQLELQAKVMYKTLVCIITGECSSCQYKHSNALNIYSVIIDYNLENLNYC